MPTLEKKPTPGEPGFDPYDFDVERDTVPFPEEESEVPKICPEKEVLPWYLMDRFV